jgi:hypothetical protein
MGFDELAASNCGLEKDPFLSDSSTLIWLLIKVPESVYEIVKLEFPPQRELVLRDPKVTVCPKEPQKHKTSKKRVNVNFLIESINFIMVEKKAIYY